MEANEKFKSYCTQQYSGRSMEVALEVHKNGEFGFSIGYKKP